MRMKPLGLVLMCGMAGVRRACGNLRHRGRRVGSRGHCEDSGGRRNQDVRQFGAIAGRLRGLPDGGHALERRCVHQHRRQHAAHRDQGGQGAHRADGRLPARRDEGRPREPCGQPGIAVYDVRPPAPRTPRCSSATWYSICRHPRAPWKSRPTRSSTSCGPAPAPELIVRQPGGDWRTPRSSPSFCAWEIRVLSPAGSH